MKVHGPSKGLREIAAIVLTAWIGALLLCVAEPWLGAAHCQEIDDHHADAESASNSHGHHDDAPDKAPHEGGFCAALESTILSSAQASLIKPILDCIGVLSSPFLVSNTSLKVFAPIGLRPAKRANWAYAHEVCTFAANRSLAPPCT